MAALRSSNRLPQPFFLAYSAKLYSSCRSISERKFGSTPSDVASNRNPSNKEESLKRLFSPKRVKQQMAQLVTEQEKRAEQGDKMKDFEVQYKKDFANLDFHNKK